jgi:hypothetical protein
MQTMPESPQQPSQRECPQDMNFEEWEETLMGVMIGSPQPVTTSYPEDHPLVSIKRP